MCDREAFFPFRAEVLSGHMRSCREEHEERLRKRGIVLKTVPCKFNGDHALPRLEVVLHETWLCPDRNRGEFEWSFST